MLVGYDIDGVIAQERFPQSITRIGYRYFNTLWARFVQSSAKCLYKPKGQFVIITGRLIFDEKHTWNWLTRNGINPLDVYFATNNRTPHLHKKSCIERLGLKMFIESEKWQADYLTSECPNCKIVLWENFT